MSIDVVENPLRVQKTSSLAISTSANILSDIYKPEHNIAIWQRTLSKELTKDINLMLAQELDWHWYKVSRQMMLHNGYEAS